MPGAGHHLGLICAHGESDALQQGYCRLKSGASEVIAGDGSSPWLLAALQGTDTPSFHSHFIGRNYSHGFNLTAREAGKHSGAKGCLPGCKGKGFVFLVCGFSPSECLRPNPLIYSFRVLFCFFFLPATSFNPLRGGGFRWHRRRGFNPSFTTRWFCDFH